MTLRIGIAGPRNISQQESSQGLSAIKNVLLNISTQLASLVEHNDMVNKLYDMQGQKKPTLRITSSLAIGVDRLGIKAQATRDCHNIVDIEHAAILPFLLDKSHKGYFDDTRSQMENDQQWQELQTYTDQIKQQQKCRLIELDGDASTPDTRDAAHYRCTEYLVENVDLLIVINKETSKASQNNTPAQHRAGTKTTIKLAKEAGKPIIEIAFGYNKNDIDICIHPAKIFGSNENILEYSAPALKRLLNRVVLFDSLFSVDDMLHNVSSKDTDEKDSKNAHKKDFITRGLEQYLDDKKWLKTQNQTTDFNYQGPITSSFSWIERLLGRQIFDSFKRSFTSQKQVALLKERLKRSDDVYEADDLEVQAPQHIDEAHSWYAHFLRADALAKRFASIHRSTYLLIYFFAASALIIAAAALAYQSNTPLVIGLIIGEFVALALIYILYSSDHHNHNKWLQNRCLAEAIRPNIYLSQFGRCFSFFNIRSSDEFMYREIMGHNQSGAQWVCIQQELINRYLGFGYCRYTPDDLKKSVTFLNSAWVSGQISYHLTNAAKMQAIGKRFSKNTHWLFFLTVVALFCKAVLKFEFFGQLATSQALMNTYLLSALYTAIFPILGTALFAIRNHSEFDISAQRSLTMLAFFNSIYSSIRGKSNGVSKYLDTDLKRLTDVSAQEMSDWLEIYEVKESEPG
jgi:hypothetical protein